jgi:hypothetical protein
MPDPRRLVLNAVPLVVIADIQIPDFHDFSGFQAVSAIKQHIFRDADDALHGPSQALLVEASETSREQLHNIPRDQRRIFMRLVQRNPIGDQSSDISNNLDQRVPDASHFARSQQETMIDVDLPV